MPEFDKYAPYVFWAYGLAALVLGGLLVWSVLRLRQAHKALKDAESEEQQP